MEFGAVEGLEGVDFSPAPADPRTIEVLAAAGGGRPRVHVGATGWSMRAWVGSVYPPGTPPELYLEAYGRQFNGIELNATAHRVPDEATVRRWRDAVPDGFTFCPKFPQELGQGPELGALAGAGRDFAGRVQQLGDRLGTAFLQLGPGVSPRALRGLATFLEALPAGFPVAVEFRHPGWFTQRRLLAEAFDLLHRFGHAAVITDTAGRRDVSHGSLPAPRVMVRFVGNGLHPTDSSRLEDWARTLAGWLEAGLREAHFFLHQPDNLLAPEASNAFIERLLARRSLPLRPWSPAKPLTRQLSLL